MANCPSAEYHGKPHRYCSCGWMEEIKADPDEFLKKAKRSVVTASKAMRLHEEDVYIVWFAKVLGNWKALISTDAISGLYWEVTYNGNNKETYVDTYSKSSNVAIAD